MVGGREVILCGRDFQVVGGKVTMASVQTADPTNLKRELRTPVGGYLSIDIVVLGVIGEYGWKKKRVYKKRVRKGGP